MDNDFYNSVNDDVIRNKEIQKLTGISPAQERHKLMQDVREGKHLNNFKLEVESWRTGWRVKFTRRAMEDFAGYDLRDLGLPSFYMKGRYDFNCAVTYFYPFPIAIATAIRVWAWHHMYELIETCLRFQIYERRIAMDKEAEYKRGYAEGRDFEFRTAQQHERDRIRLNSPL